MVARLFSSLEGFASSPAEAPKPAEGSTVVAAGIRVRRRDDFVLLVRPASGVGSGVWSLPMAQMPEQATAEATAALVLRDGLRMEPGRLQFAETLTIDHDGIEVVVNVFDAIGWSGEPRYAERNYLDAAWVNPAALDGVEIVPEVSAWLSGAEPPAPEDTQPEKLTALLIEARTELLEAYDAIPPAHRERELDRGWAPVDILALIASAEAYLFREARQLIDAGAHPWRPFNLDQWEADRLYRARPADAEVVARLGAVQTATLSGLAWLTQAQLAYTGSRAPSSTGTGVIRVGEAIATIAAHDREHIDQLRKMQGISRSTR